MTWYFYFSDLDFEALSPVSSIEDEGENEEKTLKKGKEKPTKTPAEKSAIKIGENPGKSLFPCYPTTQAKPADQEKTAGQLSGDESKTEICAKKSDSSDKSADNSKDVKCADVKEPSKSKCENLEKEKQKAEKQEAGKKEEFSPEPKEDLHKEKENTVDVTLEHEEQ